MKHPVRHILLLVILIAAIAVLANGLFTVHEGEQAVVTQFRRPVRVVKETGLHLKTPFIQKVERFQKRLIAWDGYPESIPTRDKKNVFVDVWARWRISDPKVFLQVAQTERGGQKILDDLVDSAVRDVVAGYVLIEVVRSSTRELEYSSIELQEEQRGQAEAVTVGREKINRLIRESASRNLVNTGMELVDVEIKRINYVESVRKSVYERMRSERQRIAQLYISEAKEQEQRIQGETQRELAQIRGEAQGKAARIRGEADAEVIGMYAEALSRSPEFYSFIRRLDVYREALDNNTTLILTTDSDLLRTLKSSQDGR